MARLDSSIIRIYPGIGSHPYIKSFKFGPPDVTVKEGGKITWTNSDSAGHTATADNRAFDTGTLHQGDSKVETFDKTGTYSYSCQFHSFMKGRIVVQ